MRSTKLDRGERFHLVDVREESERPRAPPKAQTGTKASSSATSKNQDPTRRIHHPLLRRGLSLGLAARELAEDGIHQT
jgi:hypothetical protein